MTTAIHPIPNGAEWMARPGSQPTVVTHPEHIKRLLSEGWRVVGDPRTPEGARAITPTLNEDELRRQVELLQAQLAEQAALLNAQAREAFGEPSNVRAIDGERKPARHKA